MHYVNVVELHVIVNYIKILIVAQQCFYGKFMSSVKIERILSFRAKGLVLHQNKEYSFASGLLLDVLFDSTDHNER